MSAGSADCARSDFDSVRNSLDGVLLMVESLETRGSFEATVGGAVRVLIEHMRVLSTNCSVVSGTIDTAGAGVAGADQCARRNTVVVIGIDYKRETETFGRLAETVGHRVV